jgi:hypothetical protein
VIGADWLWVIMAFVLAQLAYLTLGRQNVGSVAGPLPFGRAVAVEVAMTLSVSLRAFRDHLWLPVPIVLITLAGIIGGVSPSPGGMGVVEAGMILGLTAAGV